MHKSDCMTNVKPRPIAGPLTEEIIGFDTSTPMPGTQIEASGIFFRSIPAQK